MPLLSSTVTWAQSMLNTFIPLSAIGAGEPALTIANTVVGFMLNAPFTWPTNRAEDTSLVTVAGTQDYTLNLANFGFLETVTLTNSLQQSWAVPRIYNSSVLGKTSQQQARPEACCVKLWTPGTSVSLRFMGAPDAIYTGTTTYQMAPVLFTDPSQDWFTQCNIPPNQMQIYNNLFLSECFQVNGDDQSAAQYRRRGMAALLAMADGLTEMQKSMIFAQAMFSDLQTLAATIRTQSAGQARAI